MTRRHGIVGTGARSQMFMTAPAGAVADDGEPAAWCDGPAPPAPEVAGGTRVGGR